MSQHNTFINNARDAIANSVSIQSSQRSNGSIDFWLNIAQCYRPSSKITRYQHVKRFVFRPLWLDLQIGFHD